MDNDRDDTQFKSVNGVFEVNVVQMSKEEQIQLLGEHYSVQTMKTSRLNYSRRRSYLKDELNITKVEEEDSLCEQESDIDYDNEQAEEQE